MKPASLRTLLLLALSVFGLAAASATALGAAEAAAGEMPAVPLYGDKAIPNAKPGPDEETGADKGWIRNVSRPTIQPFLPDPAKATGASILVIPGGGYSGLTFAYEGVQQARYFADHGIAAFVLKYRLPSDRTMVDKSVGPIEDAQQGLRFIRLHAREWKLDPGRVGVAGFSAGGHVAATLITHFDKAYVENPEKVSLRPDFAVLVYPVISMDAKITHMDSRKNLLGPAPSDALVKLFSNELQVTPQTPPTLVLHAVDDKLVDVDNSIVFVEAMRKAGAPVEARLFAKGQHGFPLQPRERWQGSMIEWIGANGWTAAAAK